MAKNTKNPTAQADWRAIASAKIESAGTLIEAAMQVDEGPEAWTLMTYSRPLLAKALRQVRSAAYGADDVQSPVYDMLACFRGAAAIEETPLAMKALLAQAIALAEDVSTLLDDSTLSATRATTGPEYAAGLAEHLCADLREVIEGSAATDVEADRLLGLAHGVVLLLERAAGNAQPDAFMAQAVALLGIIEDTLICTEKDCAVLYSKITEILATLGRACDGSAQSPADVAEAVPRPDSRAGGASEDDFDDRVSLAVDAAVEIDGLAKIVSQQIAGNQGAAPLVSMLRRVSRLACVTLSALDDEVESFPSIKARFEETHEAGHG